jgi:molybdenum cofactor biosynthesis enzyme MoaA
MKAQSLQVNLLGPCNARCPFCIAKTTWKTGVKDNDMLFANLDRAYRFAKYHRVDSVMVTGTGEPTLIDGMYIVVDRARQFEFPAIEIQTNGMRLSQKPAMLKDLVSLGLTGLAISIASPDPARNCEIIGVDFDYLQLMQKASEMGLLCRVALNMVKGEINDVLLRDWAGVLVAHGIHQLTLREIGLPEWNPLDTTRSHEVKYWVQQNALDAGWIAEIEAEIKGHGVLVRQTPFGSDIYDYHGLSTCLARCMVENPLPDEIRSMILQPDSHVYSSWQLPGSILI